MAYRVSLSPAASRALGKLRGVPLVALRGAVLALADQPRPGGSAKLVASLDLWRIRLRIDGQPWRIVYQVRDAERLVIVTRVVRRDEGTYRRILRDVREAEAEYAAGSAQSYEDIDSLLADLRG